MATADGGRAGPALLELLRPFSAELARAVFEDRLPAWSATAHCRRLYGGILWGGFDKPVDFLQAFGPRTLTAAEELLDALLDWLPEMEAEGKRSGFQRRTRQLAELVATLAAAAASEFAEDGPDVVAGFNATYEMCVQASVKLAATCTEAYS